MDKVKITPKYTAREQRLRNRLEETSFQLAQQTELAGGYLLEVFSLKGQLEAAEVFIKEIGALPDKWKGERGRSSVHGHKHDCAKDLQAKLRERGHG